jgi:hypothetical protein
MARKILRDTYSDAAFYTLIGISCHLKDYRLSYLLNNKLEFFFTKQPDLLITLQEKKEATNFSFYYYKDEEPGTSYWLIGNRSEEYIMVPELKQLDFLLMVEGDFKKSRKSAFVKAIASIPNVLTAYEINLTGIKNFENLLTEMEIQLMNIFRIPKTKIETHLKK